MKGQRNETEQNHRQEEKSPTRKEISPILPPEGFIRLPIALAVLGIGRTSFLAGVKDGKYPQPVRLGPRITAWRVEDIRAVIARFADKIAQ